MKNTHFAYFIVLLSGCIPQPPPSISAWPDPHNHVTPIYSKPCDPSRIADIAILSTPNMPASKLNQQRFASPDGRYEAYLAKQRSTYGYDQDILLVKSSGSNMAYRLYSHDFAHRPISGITWISPTVLCFDIFTGPNYGWHYLVDISSLKSIYAAAFDRQYK